MIPSLGGTGVIPEKEQKTEPVAQLQTESTVDAKEEVKTIVVGSNAQTKSSTVAQNEEQRKEATDQAVNKDTSGNSSGESPTKTSEKLPKSRQVTAHTAISGTDSAEEKDKLYIQVGSEFAGITVMLKATYLKKLKTHKVKRQADAKQKREEGMAKSSWRDSSTPASQSSSNNPPNPVQTSGQQLPSYSSSSNKLLFSPNFVPFISPTLLPLGGDTPACSPLPPPSAVSSSSISSSVTITTRSKLDASSPAFTPLPGPVASSKSSLSRSLRGTQHSEQNNEDPASPSFGPGNTKGKKNKKKKNSRSNSNASNPNNSRISPQLRGNGYKKSPKRSPNYSPMSSPPLKSLGGSDQLPPLSGLDALGMTGRTERPKLNLVRKRGGSNAVQVSVQCLLFLHIYLLLDHFGHHK